jgi:heat shock protein HslJ
MLRLMPAPSSHSLPRLRVTTAALALGAAAFVASAAPPLNATLRDTRWTLQTLDGTAVGPAVQGRDAHLVLGGRSQHLAGFAGCNTLKGRYVQRGTQIALTPFVATRKACAEPVMQREAQLLAMLGAIDAYRIEGTVLSLLQRDQVRATFRVAGTTDRP